MATSNSGAVFFLGTRAHYQVLQPPDTGSCDQKNGNESTETIYQNRSSIQDIWPDSTKEGEIQNTGNYLTGECGNWMNCGRNENRSTTIECNDNGIKHADFEFGSGVTRRLKKNKQYGSNEQILNGNEDTIEIDPTALNNLNDRNTPKPKSASRPCASFRAFLASLKAKRKRKLSSEELSYVDNLKNVLDMCTYKDSCRCLDCQHGDTQDGGKAPRLPLNDGNSIPTIGLGTFLGFDEKGQKDVKPGDVSTPLEWAIEAGYRMLDTASAYKNEDDVGVGVRNSISKGILKREDIYVVTKLSSTEPRNVIEALRGSLRRLNMDYVDLYLIHSPVAFTPNHSAFDVIDYLDTWKSMEETKKLGLAKSIGLSNFNQSQIQRILDNANIKPSVLQVEVNLNLGQDSLIKYAKEKGIVVMAYTPFGSIFESQASVAPPPRIDDPQLKTIAEKYGKTVPQIVLRYLVQRGLVPIPKSVHKNRIEENIDIFNFELTPEEMETLAKFNKDYRTVYPSYLQDHPYYPFERKDIPDKSPF